ENKSATDGGTRMVNQSKYTNALTRGGSGAHPTGDGGNGNGNGGQSTSSPQDGGNGVVPVYGAGAGGQLRKHKGGASTYTPCLKTRVTNHIQRQTSSFKNSRCCLEACEKYGKAMWIVGTTFLILVVPLIIEMDREAQFNDLEWQQAALYGGAPPQKM
ncbi:mitochondrial import receptor subunit TOM9-2, partial [Tanacetum coccineum]